MITPEEPQGDIRRHEVAIARAEKLKAQIVRAERWDQLFPNSEEAEADFLEYLINDHRFYYGKNDSRTEYHIEPDSEGDIHSITRDKGYTTTYQRLASGDVILVLHYPDKPPSVKHITPNIGNIAHPFTRQDVLFQPTEEIVLRVTRNRELYKEISSAVGVDFTLLSSRLRGKPATQGWEDTMLSNGHIPQRIGFSLFPNYALEGLKKLKGTYPHLLPQSQT